MPIIKSPQLLIFILSATLSLNFNIHLQTPIKPLPEFQNKSEGIYLDSILVQKFNDTEYQRVMTCTNDMFQIVEFNVSQRNKQILTFSYTQLSLSKADIRLQYGPLYPDPQPTLLNVDDDNKIFTIANGCLQASQLQNYNYYNELTVWFMVVNEQGLKEEKSFSLLYNCEFEGRHKKFEIGYLLICFLNACITIGVALHSRIWSIRFNKKPLCLELKWYRFLIIIISTIAIGTAIYIYANEEFKSANIVLMYLGLSIGLFFTFICADEMLFLVSSFKKQIKVGGKGYLRICDIVSVLVAMLVFGLSILFPNWIMMNIVAICICVGSIKLLQFSSMKQAILSMVISTFFVTLSASVMHWLLERSYNDYANQLASPLFIALPDLVYNLFKKCSWLPVLDIIIPGVFLSYLRGYDENYSSTWGGVYTIVGNLSFIAGTMIWIPIEGAYDYSVPFCLVSYPTLILGVSIIAYKRNQFTTLWTGRFNGPHNQFSQRLLQVNESRVTFGKMIGKQILEQIKIKKSQNDSEIVVS